MDKVELSLGIAFRMPLVRRQLAPTLAVPQVIGRGPRRDPPQPFVQRRLEVADHPDSAGLRPLQEGRQKGGFLVAGPVLSSPPPRPGPASPQRLPFSMNRLRS